MKILKKSALFVLFLLSSHLLDAQEVEMADTMRSNGKIYVVVAIIVTILIGIVVYLFAIDRKLSRLEKKRKD